MEPKLAINPKPSRASSRDQVRQMHHAAPDFYDRPRRRIPPMVVAGMAFAIAAAGFYGAENLLPAEYKPSVFTGGYAKAMAEAEAAGRSEGEAQTKVKVEKVLKLIETEAASIQEECKASFQRSNDLYRSIWDRNNTMAKAYAEQRNSNAALRNQVVANTTAGQQQVANTADWIGVGAAILGLPDIADKSFEAAQTARDRATDILDDAMRRGVPVSEEAMAYALPDPSQLPPMTQCKIPSSLVTAKIELGG